jgi:hypothetical protein
MCHENEHIIDVRQQIPASQGLETIDFLNLPFFDLIFISSMDKSILRMKRLGIDVL